MMERNSALRKAFENWDAWIFWQGWGMRYFWSRCKVTIKKFLICYHCQNGIDQDPNGIWIRREIDLVWNRVTNRRAVSQLNKLQLLYFTLADCKSEWECTWLLTACLLIRCQKILRITEIMANWSTANSKRQYYMLPPKTWSVSAPNVTWPFILPPARLEAD